MSHRSGITISVFMVFIASTSLAGCIIPAFEADCSEGTDCESCLEQSGCGWCISRGALMEGRCALGTSFGPDNEDLCFPNEWRFSSCDEESRACNDSCSYGANNGVCDEPGVCDPGTDCSDCR